MTPIVEKLFLYASEMNFHPYLSIKEYHHYTQEAHPCMLQSQNPGSVPKDPATSSCGADSSAGKTASKPGLQRFHRSGSRLSGRPVHRAGAVPSVGPIFSLPLSLRAPRLPWNSVPHSAVLPKDRCHWFPRRRFPE